MMWKSTVQQQRINLPKLKTTEGKTTLTATYMMTMQFIVPDYAT